MINDFITSIGTILEDGKMVKSLKGLYQQFMVHQDPTINTAINVLIIIVTGAVAWWIFNLVLSKLENRYKERPFFKRNNQLEV